jgi:hypothetical protein
MLLRAKARECETCHCLVGSGSNRLKKLHLHKILVINTLLWQYKAKSTNLAHYPLFTICKRRTSVCRKKNRTMQKTWCGNV